MFEASDGEVAIAPSNDAFYRKLLEALDLQHLQEDSRFRTNADRYARRSAINAEINAQTRTRPVEHWIEKLNAAGVPCGRVMQIGEVFDDPQTRHQQMRITIEHPQLGAIDVLGFPIKFTDAPCSVHRPPPVLGADTDAILAELGRDPMTIATLRANRVI